MTHSLHRKGTVDSLMNDYVLFAISAQEVNAKGSKKLFKKFFNIIEKYNYKNIGDMKTGNMYSVGIEEIKNNFEDNSIVHAVFTDKKEVIKALNDLKEEDLGLSIVVSGLINDVEKICKESGTEFHTVNNSLGVWGKTELLPEEEVVQISTMCGHGMVAFKLVENLAMKVKTKKLGMKDAVKEITKQCHCGIVNPTRTEELINDLIN